ncbi:MAG: hypothetical protein RID91_11965 [Azospirillaceae bacterium]
MTRRGATRQVDSAFAEGRLHNARAYLQSARDAMALADGAQSLNPAMSQIVNATIAYVDALTARRRGLINQKDHQAALGLLRDVLGNELPRAQITNVRAILERKDEVQLVPPSGGSSRRRRCSIASRLSRPGPKPR